MTAELQKMINGCLGSRVVGYSPELAKMLGSVNAAILFGQLLFWYGMGTDKEWTYKNVDDFQAETGLSRTQQKNAIKICIDLGILEVKLARVPATRHFRIKREKLLSLVLSYKKYSNQVVPKNAGKIAGFDPTTTEITNDITSENIFLKRFDQLVRERLSKE